MIWIGFVAVLEYPYGLDIESYRGAGSTCATYSAETTESTLTLGIIKISWTLGGTLDPKLPLWPPSVDTEF